MKARTSLFIAAMLGLLALCPAALADWTEPVPLTEVNTDYHDKAPFLSFDGLTLYFCRDNGPWGWTTRIYQATRQQPYGPFTLVEEISALNLPDAIVADPWVSPDNLRMYYCRTGGGRARLMLTRRTSVSDPWLPGVEIVELSVLGNVYNPDLTADELTMVFCGDNLPGGQGGLDIWIATRPDTNSPFTNITNLAETNSSASDGHPYISPDGLILYFASDRNGAYQLFRATRESRDAPFGNLEHLSFFDSPDSSVQYPFLSSDGSAFYFGKWKSGEFMDIYVSYLHTPQWSQPVPVTEVNTEYEEWAPFLSFDGLSLYFSRVQTYIPHYGRIYQACRNTSSGPFTSVIEISELNESATNVLCPWVSPDNLRMYYHTESSIGWQLKFSERASTSAPWPLGKGISELNQISNRLVVPKLTADELTIFFHRAEPNGPGGQWQHDIWMATRPDRNSPFSQVRKLDEISTASDEAHPCPSPDGLELYFASTRSGNFQLFKATRESLDAPFSNVEHLSFFDTPGGHSLFPCLTSDGKTFYFVRQVGASSSRDIWVSYASEIPPVPEPDIYYVDGVNGNDNNNGLSLQTAFATIQKGINTAEDGDTVLAYPGLYQEGIDFLGKAITVQGVATSAGVAIIENPSDFAVSFYNGEEPNSILENFVIKNSFIALFIASSSPTISNLTIIGNSYGAKCYAGADPIISNCIFWNNTEADLVGCQAQYSWVQRDIKPEPLEGLISLWKFDEGSGTTAHDSVGNNHGTIHGAQWTTGILGGALDFGGDGDYVQVPDDDSLTPSSQITICFWVYNRGGQAAAIQKYAECPDQPSSPGNSRAYCFAVTESGKAVIWIFSSRNNSDGITSTNTVPFNEWHHVAGTFNKGQAALYLDGQLDSSAMLSVSSIMNDAQPLIIGGFWQYCGTDNFLSQLNGLTDEVRIYNRALSAEEIQQLHQSGLSGGELILDPLFADPANGDYHLLSRRGRYWPQHDVLVLDKVTSPCIDGGDPAVDPSGEPMPNGGRIDMGAYGGTPYASMSEWPVAGDINHDGVVDLVDMAIFCNDWLSTLPWTE